MAQARCNIKKGYSHLPNTRSSCSESRGILLTSKGIKNQAEQKSILKTKSTPSQRGRREGIFVFPPAIIGKHRLRTPEQGMLAGTCSLFACFVPNCCSQDTSGHEFGVGGWRPVPSGRQLQNAACQGRLRPALCS